MSARTFLSREERRQVEEAVGRAENSTSGEIRIYLTDRCSEQPEADALNAFQELGMTATAARNGVLIYVATESRRVVIYGDEGINKVVPEGYWNVVCDGLTSAFSQGRRAEGLCRAVQDIGEKLGTWFPHQADDRNELSDEIAINDESTQAD